jgi:hypothetical protein
MIAWFLLSCHRPHRKKLTDSAIEDRSPLNRGGFNDFFLGVSLLGGETHTASTDAVSFPGHLRHRIPIAHDVSRLIRRFDFL